MNHCTKPRKFGVLFSLSGLFLFLIPPNAKALPSFARQTGMTCTVCHTVFPELTPFGRVFKLDGYTFSTGTE